MTDAATVPLADTSDMIGLHRVFREALALAPQLVGSVAPGDTARADLVGSYYANVLSLLHGHHEGEDVLVTPRLVERCPEEAATIERIAGQHAVVLGALDAAESLIGPWREAPDPESGARLSAALGVLQAELTPHLDEEERVVLPIAARHITAPEWGELPAHGMQHFGGDKLWLILGLIQEQMTPAQIEAMEAHMPPPVAQSWTTAGRPQFEAFVAALRS